MVGADGSTDSELEFGFSGTVELLVDGRIIAVKLDVGPSAIRETFENHGLIWRHSQHGTELK